MRSLRNLIETSRLRTSTVLVITLTPKGSNHEDLHVDSDWSVTILLRLLFDPSYDYIKKLDT